jgi:TonB family protein
VKEQRLLHFCLISSLIHLLVIALASMLMTNPVHSRYNFITIHLTDIPKLEEKKDPAPAPKPPEKRNETTPSKPISRQATLPEEPSKAQFLREPPKAVEPEAVATPPSAEGGGKSEIIAREKSDAGNGVGLSDLGNAGLRPGTSLESNGVGSSTGPSGLGTADRAFRAAKPIQTVRANYPPMALRMGMESDVTLKIEVDMEGKVTRAEIAKSGGAGFDEEALRAVKQSRFEPAQRDGHNVPAEFVYIYRFRLQK